MFNVEFLHVIREYEIERIVPYLRSGMRILEIGGGTGFQAKKLSEYGFEVVSIDVPDSNYRQRQEFPVEEYDGRKFGFPDKSFDVVYSSNVLEHIADLPQVHLETWRVLKPSGFAVHVMPTSSWRFWTIIAHYVEMFQRLSREVTQVLENIKSHGHPNMRQAVENMGDIWRRYRMVSKHGEFGNAVTEIVTFSWIWWLWHFRKHGIKVIKRKRMGLFYTGYMILGSSLSLRTREIAAYIFGSACSIFVVRPPERS